jgi:hypothetical protein
MGLAYVQLGRLDQARAWLQRSIETGFACYPWYLRDPLLEPLRGDEASRALLDNLKRRWEAARARYPA